MSGVKKDIRSYFGSGAAKPAAAGSVPKGGTTGFKRPLDSNARASKEDGSARKKKPKIEDDDEVVVVVDSDSDVTQKAKVKPQRKTPAKTPAAKRATPTSQPTDESPAKPKKATPAAKASKAAKEEVPADVKAAIAAVDAAAEALPLIEPDLMDEAGFGMGGAETAPPNAGSKVVPKGHPQCLTNKTFVITGVLDSLWRNEAEDLIKRHNGRVTGSVSGRTTFLLRGEQAGKSKTAQAVAKGTQIIDEDGLLALIKAAPDSRAAKVTPPASTAAPMETATATQLKAELNRPPASSKAVRASMANGSGLSSSSRAALPLDNQLWVEKHRPKTSSELVGNNTAIANLRQWLQSWDAVHLHGQDAGAQKGRGKPKDMSKKAVLLSGPPGIGKTTSALIITKELGFTAIEVNASDTRNKSDSKITAGIGGKLANAVKELATNTAIGKDASGKRKKICLVMDEVDGMSGSDRGGVAELINTIKSSKVPIVCICNDRYNMKLRSLRNSTLELDFRKPTGQQIVSRMSHICRLEGLQVSDQTLQALAEGTNGDIRLVLGQLQMIRLRTQTLSYDEAKGKLGTNKDADMSPFEAARKLLSTETTRMSLMDRAELVFQDLDLVPLLIQENYLNHRPALIGGNEGKRMSVVARAADEFSCGDIVNRAIRQHQRWSLMPFGATVGSVLPAFYMRGFRETFFPGEMNFPRFTSWLGNYSSANKQRRLMGELHARMLVSGSCCTDRVGLRTGHLPALRSALVKPLIDNEKDGIADVVSMMQGYCMNKEDFEFIQAVTHFKGSYPWNEDLYKSVPTAVKTAFTRQLNQTIAHQKPKSHILVEEIKLKRGKKAAAAAANESEQQDGLGGDPELEAAAAAERKNAEAQGNVKSEEDDEEEEELSAKDKQALERKQRTLAKRGVTFEAKADLSKGRKSAGRGSGGAASGRGGGRGRGRGRQAKAK